MIQLEQFKVHDLTLPMNSLISGYSHEIAKELEKDGWNAKWLHIYSHAGTHMDAPDHFGVSAKTIDQFEPKAYMGKAWIVRLEEIANKQLIDLEHIAFLEGKFELGDSLLIQTNWHKRLGKQEYKEELPRISKLLAKWCVEKQVKILGVEPPSVADVNNLAEVTEIHHILLKGNVLIVEGLAHLDQITQDQVFLVALPLKIAKGDGAPARVIAFEAL